MPSLTTPDSTYQGIFESAGSRWIMEAGRILPPGMSPGGLIERVHTTVRALDGMFEPDRSATALADEFCASLRAGVCTLGTPALTNAAFGDDRPLGSCAAGPDGADLDVGSIEAAYAMNMGAGFNLNASREPARELRWLEAHAAAFEQRRRPERYVGNIAHVDVGHEDLEAFVSAKASGRATLPHFNISVNFSSDEADAAEDPASPSGRALGLIADAAWECGDPGLISLDRFNEANPLLAVAPYTTVAPCAEVGLAPGDTCVFGYISLPALLRGFSVEDFDVDALRRVVRVLVRVLDGVVERTCRTLASAEARSAARAKRRIAIGVCGVADLLLWLGLPYDSAAARDLVREILSVVAYESLLASRDLGAQRGSCTAASLAARPIREIPEPTQWVSTRDWHRLVTDVNTNRTLRNISRTALPPAGRTARILGVTPSIEPLNGRLEDTLQHAALREHATARWADRPGVLRTATELSWQSHLALVRSAAVFLDESVSKTVNLPHRATRRDVRDVFATALAGGMKAVSVYRQRTPA